MNLVFQAFIGSIAIHIIYLVGMMLVGYIKTRNYKPDIASAWDKVETLQNEVVFGKVNSPFLYLFTFVGVTVICGIVIFSYKKLFNIRFPS
ncbi:hypothetical protein EI200_25380 [Peribacillus simplex]|uniref:hypothetical protein n=1 Tax=Peribacillus simplex TaxID=1478 RepID=UPI000F62FDE9|nr:hypothetical protein [Peribacillus simplex]RRN66711.1 hypothetical protein EI200_25380 [Peribacillus simplex]